MITCRTSRVRYPYPFTGDCNALLPLFEQRTEDREQRTDQRTENRRQRTDSIDLLSVRCPLFSVCCSLSSVLCSLLAEPAASVTCLSPVHYRRRTPRPVSYYALLKWWLLLSQHPGCLRNPTSFRTEHVLGTLAGDLGCSPLDDEAYPPPSSCRCCCMVFGVWFGWVAG